MNEILIDIKSVNRIYRDTTHREVYALQNVNLQIRDGEFITLIGPSGCGKTTLLRLIAGLDKPQSGVLTARGQNIESPDHKRGYIFQQPTLFPWLTIEQNVAIGLKARKIHEEKKDMISRYINIIGLKGFENSYPHEISGGMAQRAAIIRALINEPEVLLLDEPLASLDAFTRIELQNLLLKIWQKTKKTMVMVTHDVDEAIYLSNRIVIMSARPGKITDILEIKLGDNRNRGDNTFMNLRKEILAKLHLSVENKT
ncbi:MAG: ABC transporter ATP-binding protein, partial [Elusimicrobiota bacterium]|nr:ABC transporter ATP-binding protein [Elusimicrobiota bacterium]